MRLQSHPNPSGRLFLRSLGVALTLRLAFLACLSFASSATAAVPREMHQFVEKWCIDCHDADSNKGGLNLDGLDFAHDEAAHAKWVRVFDQVLGGQMPPPKKARADEATKRAFLTVLGSGLMQQHTAMKGTVLRRLNRTEYENTLRDLLGVHVEVADLLPADSLAHGFDNIGDALGMSEVQLRRYMEAAESALDTLLRQPTKPETQKADYTYANSKNVGKSWLARPDGAVVFFTAGGFPSTSLDSFKAPASGMYRVRITGYGYQTQEPVAFALHSGIFFGTTPTEFIGYFDLPPTPEKSGVIETTAFIKKRGDSLKISPRITPNQVSLQRDGIEKYAGVGLAIQKVEIEGPLVASWPPRGLTLLFGDLPIEETKKFGKTTVEVKSAQPDADAAKLLRGFASAAFRRPVNDAKTAPYVALFKDEMKDGASFLEAMRTAATAILCSPDFLYLREPAGRLDDHALATRLAYFLTRTAPDDALLKAAAAGQLRQPAMLRAQTERLLASDASRRFTADFTDAWLNLRDIEFTMPDKQLYPEFDALLQDAAVRETRAFFDEMLRGNLPISNLISSDFAMLNARLAEHYGLPEVKGLALQKVKLPPDSKRGGILTQAAVLKVSANGTNTSPVLRGTYVLERILGTPPPPPPPGVPGLEPDIRGAKSLREQLDLHRNMESCQGCHRVIDPPGFALENYDPIGGWRENFRSLGEGKPAPPVDGQRVRYKIGPAVDASGQLLSGTKFNGFADFQKLLLGSQEMVAKCVAEKLLMFGTGRELGFSDRNELTRLAKENISRRAGLRDLLHAVVQSEIFLSK